MRQRKPKNLSGRLQAYSEHTVENPRGEIWKSIFPGNGPLFLEIGCGKGRFILSKALENPGCGYIGAEGSEAVILRALEKAFGNGEEKGAALLSPDEKKAAPAPRNLKFIMKYIDEPTDFFSKGQLEGIYLNFSDPWPKARHEKRRLTHRTKLRSYGEILRAGGAIEIKTDDPDFFRYTLGEIFVTGYHIVERTEDLHRSACAARRTLTEYEERFIAWGRKINYVKVIGR